MRIKDPKNWENMGPLKTHLIQTGVALRCVTAVDVVYTPGSQVHFHVCVCGK